MSNAADSLQKRRASLEEAFYMEEDRKLIEKYRELQKMDENKRNLAHVSGIHNEAVLKKLVELDVRAETLASLAVVPLVEVAWADNVVDEQEKKAVLKAAAKIGFKKGEIDYSLLEQWLTHKPKQEMLVAWENFVKGLCEALPHAERDALRDELLGHAREVAAASGGFLGLTSKVSDEEEKVLKRLSAAFVTTCPDVPC
jgi:hypothetical protein